MAGLEGSLEGMVMSFWQGKRVFITGHTGFKGSWLSLWLLELGAKVYGYSLDPETQPALFHQLGLAKKLEHQIGDIRDTSSLSQAILEFAPDVIFHLAAQPLVRRSYFEPVATWEINVLGTIHVLESLKKITYPCASVFITTDKCYENREWVFSYRENDPLGGYDPYSSSKAGAEIAIASWRRSYFQAIDGLVKVASVRAGNVIGGGDWSEDRIVPDAMRALQNQETIPVRNPQSTRPWQHVLEPLGGYLLLAEKLYRQIKDTDSDQQQLDSAFNFGPNLSSNRPVKELVETVLKNWPGQWHDCSDPNAVHEAKLLNLTTDKAFHTLGWQPVWEFERTIRETVFWYRQAAQLSSDDHDAFTELTIRQIRQYTSDRDFLVSSLLASFSGVTP